MKIFGSLVSGFSGRWVSKSLFIGVSPGVLFLNDSIACFISSIEMVAFMWSLAMSRDMSEVGWGVRMDSCCARYSCTSFVLS